MNIVRLINACYRLTSNEQQFINEIHDENKLCKLKINLHKSYRSFHHINLCQCLGAIKPKDLNKITKIG